MNIKTFATAGDQLKATVPELTEGNEYVFHVMAVNKEGPSDPSEPSRPQVAKQRYGKHCISRTDTYHASLF